MHLIFLIFKRDGYCLIYKRNFYAKAENVNFIQLKFIIRIKFLIIKLTSLPPMLMNTLNNFLFLIFSFF